VKPFIDIFGRVLAVTLALCAAPFILVFVAKVWDFAFSLL